MRTGSDADGGSFEPIVEPHGYPAANAATQLARRGKVAARSAAQIAFVGREDEHICIATPCGHAGRGVPNRAGEHAMALRVGSPTTRFNARVAIVEDDKPTPYMRAPGVA